MVVAGRAVVGRLAVAAGTVGTAFTTTVTLRLPTGLDHQLPGHLPALGLDQGGIGLLKGATFGIVIALVACHFGLRIEPNTESLGRGVTTSVVTSITAVILVDALFAIVFSSVGI